MAVLCAYTECAAKRRHKRERERRLRLQLKTHEPSLATQWTTWERCEWARTKDFRIFHFRAITIFNIRLVMFGRIIRSEQIWCVHCVAVAVQTIWMRNPFFGFFLSGSCCWTVEPLDTRTAHTFRLSFRCIQKEINEIYLAKWTWHRSSR